MTPKFQPTYWQLESSSMQYIVRERRHKEVEDENNLLLESCSQTCSNTDCPCFAPSVYQE